MDSNPPSTADYAYETARNIGGFVVDLRSLVTQLTFRVGDLETKVKKLEGAK